MRHRRSDDPRWHRATRAGYTGGQNANATYRNHPGHAEAVEITYDPEQTDYRALDLVQPGSVVLFSAQLGDGDPLRWIGSDPQLPSDARVPRS